MRGPRGRRKNWRNWVSCPGPGAAEEGLVWVGAELMERRQTWDMLCGERCQGLLMGWMLGMKRKERMQGGFPEFGSGHLADNGTIE